MSAPTQIAHYRITGKLGEGGMGAVYRAVDTKLNREVAIKVLPPALAHDADYIARFQREAQTLAALNHPNIATIFGIEENAIVMELVEGSTLQGPMPLQEVLPIARQIAEALEAAHEKGIIHRDLKPGNIKLTPEGVVKVLDFGLAKAVNERPVSTGPDSPTLTLRATEAGLILGTAAYMSPEQAAGKSVDRRADIWSFGVVLYELLTGKRLFDGESVTHILADVVRAPIDLTGVPLRDLIGRCLDRNLKTRLQSIGEARIAIERYAPEETKAPVAKAGRWPWAVAAVGMVIAGAAGWILRPSAPALPLTFEISPPEDGRFAPSNNAGGSAISPDGRMIAFVAINGKGAELLYVRSLDNLTARELPGTESAGRPFWSPDGKSLGFVAGGKLKRIDLAGGTPITLCDARNPRGGTWNEEGVILFGDQSRPIQRIPASGGTPAPVTEEFEKDTANAHYFPQFLPGGKRFLFLSRNRVAEKAGVFIGSLDGTPPVRLMPSAHKAEYDAASGRLLYLQGAGALMARKLELDPPRLVGDPVVIAEGVRTAGPNGYAEFSASGNGTVAYGRVFAGALSRFAWRDRSGKLLETVGQGVDNTTTGEYRLSPDGGRVAFMPTTPGAGSEVWVTELARGVSTRLSFTGGSRPRWSPDGRTVYYSTPGGMRKKASDGSGDETPIVKGGPSDRPFSVSPDGKYLLYGGNDIQVLRLADGEKPEPYLNNPGYIEWMAAFAPDGRWVAYVSNESGRFEIYVQGFPDKRGKWLLSDAGGVFPIWRADGKELYWSNTSGDVMAVSVELQQGTVKAGKPAMLFHPTGDSGVGSGQTSRDGKKFLTLEPESGAKELPMVVMQNWAARLGK